MHIHTLIFTYKHIHAYIYIYTYMFTYIYIRSTTPPPHHRGGGEHSSCISIPIPTTNYYSLLLTTTNPPPPYPPTGGAGNIAPVYPYSFLLLTTTHYYHLLLPTHPPGGAGNIAPVYPYPFLLLTITNPPHPPTHPKGGGGEHSSCISIPAWDWTLEALHLLNLLHLFACVLPQPSVVRSYRVALAATPVSPSCTSRTCRFQFSSSISWISCRSVPLLASPLLLTFRTLQCKASMRMFGASSERVGRSWGHCLRLALMLPA